LEVEVKSKQELTWIERNCSEQRKRRLLLSINAFSSKSTAIQIQLTPQMKVLAESVGRE
jgi:hypothetical protein